MKKIIALLLAVLSLPFPGTALFGRTTALGEKAEGETEFISAAKDEKSSATEYSMNLNAKSAILMDATTGTILYEQNPDEALPPASVTKVMTLLLVMEAIDSGKIALTDPVTTSEAAAKMGGSQVFLEPGEQMSVEEMIKCVVISSANDAAYALAEHIAGSEEAFVTQMNRRAAELGMNHTHFENTNGLDDTTTDHLISARDIAIASRALLSHEKILNYTTIWMDSIRNGAFVLSNTNRLVRFYPGATGLKTGSTSRALFCISATAKRGDLHLIAVIMGSPTRDIRNAEAKKLLDYGFANYALYSRAAEPGEPLPVHGGLRDNVSVTVTAFSKLMKKGDEKNVRIRLSLPEYVAAPVVAGDPVGKAEFLLGEEVIGTADIVASEDVRKISYFEILFRLLSEMVGFREEKTR